MKILVDADACPAPAKELLFKTSERRKIQLILVANQYIRIPESDLVECIVVSAGADVADDHIVEIMKSDDLIIF